MQKKEQNDSAGLAAGLTIPDSARPYRQAARVGVRVECGTCHRMKKPIGRSASLAAANGYCDDDCAGYREAPLPGSLWPGEHSDDFGYPVSEDGSVETPEKAPPVSDQAGGAHPTISPAPWGWDSRNNNHYLLDVNDEIVLGPVSPAPDARAEDDRCLIAAAPEMHSALQALRAATSVLAMAVIMGEPVTKELETAVNEAMDQSKAALAKAAGQP